MQLYDGVPIVYSVGNFIFDQMFSVQTRQGLILELVMRGDRCVNLRTRGVEIEDFNQPRLMTAGEHAAIMDRFWRTTDRIASL
jgi:poly-gamma-glutamate synthesis protein (capsule biosynthesis protein)